MLRSWGHQSHVPTRVLTLATLSCSDSDCWAAVVSVFALTVRHQDWIMSMLLCFSPQVIPVAVAVCNPHTQGSSSPDDDVSLYCLCMRACVCGCVHWASQSPPPSPEPFTSADRAASWSACAATCCPIKMALHSHRNVRTNSVSGISHTYWFHWKMCECGRESTSRQVRKWDRDKNRERRELAAAIMWQQLHFCKKHI